MKTDRVVVVTGAAGGRGALFVARFLANGDTVIATDTFNQALAKLTDRVGSQGRLHMLAADIANEARCTALSGFARERAGQVEVLINCAGFFPTQRFDEVTLGDWSKVVGINLTGVFLMVKAMLPLMKGRGSGRIINIGSASVFEGVAEHTHYIAVKAGVLGLSRSLAGTVGSHGITVNVVTPGLAVTPRVTKTMPARLLAA